MRNLKKLAVALCFLLASSSAFALGLGGYAQGEWGSGNVEVDVSGSPDVDITTSAWGIGFTLDTNPMTSGLWSYRLNLGYQANSITFDTPDGDDTSDFDGFVADNTFAFTLMSDKMMRVWAGPVVRLASFSNDEDGTETMLGAIGVGAAIGMNYQVADKFIVSPSVTGVWNYLAGSIDPFEETGDKEDLTGSSWAFGFKVDFLYDL